MDLLRTNLKRVGRMFNRKQEELQRKTSESFGEEREFGASSTGKRGLELIKDIGSISVTGEKQKVYHEMDFTSKNPIIFSDNGNIIVRSKFSRKPPLAPGSRANRDKVRRSFGFEAVKHFVDRPVSWEKIKSRSPDVARTHRSKSAHSTPKIERKIKTFKSKSLQFFGLSPFLSSTPLETEDHMFLDFSRKNRKIPRKSVQTKTCTL